MLLWQRLMVVCCFVRRLPRPRRTGMPFVRNADGSRQRRRLQGLLRHSMSLLVLWWLMMMLQIVFQLLLLLLSHPPDHLLPVLPKASKKTTILLGCFVRTVAWVAIGRC